MQIIRKPYKQENGQDGIPVAFVKFYNGVTIPKETYNRMLRAQIMRRRAINKTIKLANPAADLKWEFAILGSCTEVANYLQETRGWKLAECNWFIQEMTCPEAYALEEELKARFDKIDFEVTCINDYSDRDQNCAG